MFVQVIEGQVADREGLKRQLERWQEELRPGATGLLGSTSGVTDDGVGLRKDPEVSAQEGFGLTSMRERAAAIGAEWSIRSRRGAGTSVVVRIPKQASA